jgi:hypothetical protein
MNCKKSELGFMGYFEMRGIIAFKVVISLILFISHIAVPTIILHS